jgi:hypothetical protein
MGRDKKKKLKANQVKFKFLKKKYNENIQIYNGSSRSCDTYSKL